jgi:hypothetical protein
MMESIDYIILGFHVEVPSFVFANWNKWIWSASWYQTLDEGYTTAFPEDGSRMLVRNVGTYPLVNAVQKPKLTK